MAEAALGLSASVVAFIGLAGQVLQGCHYVCEFLDLTKSAPDDLQHLKNETNGFRAAILAFQKLIGEVGRCARIENCVEQALLALRSGNAAIEELKVLIRKFEHDGCRNWWKDIRVAGKRREFAKWIGRLGEAKSNILLAQSNTNMILSLAYRDDIQDLKRFTTSLNSSSTSATLHIAQLQNSIMDFHNTTHEALETMRVMNERVVNRVNGLPTALNAIVQRTVSNALREALPQIHHVSRVVEFKNKISIHGMNPYQVDNNSICSIESHDNLGLDAPAKTLKPKRSIRTISLAFATITIRTVEHTTQELLVSPPDGEHRLHESTTSRILIDIRFHPRITQKAFLLRAEKRLPGFSLNSDIKLRTYSIASRNSPVGIACEQGNITAMRALFVTGRASPHDILIDNSIDNGYHTSLIDKSWTQWCGSIEVLNQYYNLGTENESSLQQIVDEIRQHFEMFRFLADCGVDIGEIRYEVYSRPRLFNLLAGVQSSHLNIAPYLVKMSRLILRTAIENPMEIRVKYDEGLIYVGSELFPDIGACIWSQESWSLPKKFGSPSMPEEGLTYGIEGAGGELSPAEPLINKYCLVRDPEARYLRIHLKYYVQKAKCHLLVKFCTIAEEWAESLKLERGKSFDSAVKARLIACFQHGLDLEHGCWCTRGCTDHLIQHFLQAGKAKLLESALLEHGKSPEIIASILEEGRYCTIVDELDRLRPARIARRYGMYSQNGMTECEHRAVVTLYRKYRAMALDEGYRNYFPEDWTEIRNLIWRFDQVVFERKQFPLKGYQNFFPEDKTEIGGLIREFGRVNSERKPLPRPNPEVGGPLPAINGLGEDFWN